MATRSAGKKTSAKKKTPGKKRKTKKGVTVALFINPDDLTATQREQLRDFLDSIGIDVIAISERH